MSAELQPALSAQYGCPVCCQGAEPAGRAILGGRDTPAEGGDRVNKTPATFVQRSSFLEAKDRTFKKRPHFSTGQRCGPEQFPVHRDDPALVALRFWPCNT